MYQLIAVASSTFIQLRRDRIFLPFLLATLVLLVLSQAVSDWTIEDQDKVLFDLMSFFLELMGSVIALFWGVEVLGLARKEGEWEVQLVTPISRSLWLLGRYLGLAFCLICLGGGLAIVTQGMLFLNGDSWFGSQELWLFLGQGVGWLVLGALAVFFSTFCGKATALFASFSCWVSGLLTRVVEQSLASKPSSLSKEIFKAIAEVWDLHRFNLAPLTKVENLANYGLWMLLYGACLVSFFLALACIILHQRELAN